MIEATPPPASLHGTSVTARNGLADGRRVAAPLLSHRLARPEDDSLGVGLTWT